MTDRHLTVITGGKVTNADACDAAELRARLASSGAEFVARLDLQSAQARFSELLDASTEAASAEEAAVTQYREFVAAFPVSSSPVRLDRHRAVEDATIGGRVTCFDIARGHGLVTPDNGLPDIYLHVNALRLGGFRECPEGARVVCLVTRESDRYRVVSIHAMDCSTTIDPMHLPRRFEPVATRVGSWMRGTLRSFNWRGGSGVLRIVDGRDVHVALATLRRCGIAYLDDGDIFDVLVGSSDSGPIAVEIRIPGKVALS